MEIEIPFFPLKEFGRIVKREIRLEPTGKYKTVGCKLYGLGVYERETKGGSDIQANRMFSIEENDFLINRIWAQKGSAGIVPPELEGSVVTNDFPVIELDLTRVYPPYISWYVKTRKFWETCRKHSHGTSGRERLSPKELPNIEIPLPDIEEQKRIVARIESLIARIEEARRLRTEVVEEAENLLELFLRRIFLNNNQYDLVKLGDKDYFELNPSKSELSGLDDDIDVSFVPMTCVDPELGKIKNFGIRKLFEVRKGYTYFKEGDVLFAKITPCMENGNVAIAQNITNGIGFGTTEFHVVRVLEKVLPKWVYYLFRTKGFRDIAKGNMTGTAGQRRVPKSFLEQYEIPLPLLPEQRRIVAYLDSFQAKVDELKRLQAETEKELEELVPSILDKAFKGEL